MLNQTIMEKRLKEWFNNMIQVKGYIGSYGKNRFRQYGEYIRKLSEIYNKDNKYRSNIQACIIELIGEEEYQAKKIIESIYKISNRETLINELKQFREEGKLDEFIAKYSYLLIKRKKKKTVIRGGDFYA